VFFPFPLYVIVLGLAWSVLRRRRLDRGEVLFWSWLTIITSWAVCLLDLVVSKELASAYGQFVLATTGLVGIVLGGIVGLGYLYLPSEEARQRKREMEMIKQRMKQFSEERKADMLRDAQLQKSPLLIEILKQKPEEEVKQLEIRFPKGVKRYHDIRLCYVTIRNLGEKTIDEVIVSCLSNEMLIVPSTSKQTFGLDIEPQEEGGMSVQEFDKYQPDSSVTVILRDRTKVKELIEHIHPDSQGVSFVLFLTVKGESERFYVPAGTMIWYNAYGGAMNSIHDGKNRKPTMMWIHVTARDAKGFSVQFEVTLHNWKRFDVRKVQTVYDS
jgi:hypothetical protein